MAETAYALIKRGELARAFDTYKKVVDLNEELLKKDPENYDFWLARLRGDQYFAHALLEKGEKKAARAFYESALALAETEAPKKFAAFLEDFKKQVRDNLQKCDQ